MDQPNEHHLVLGELEDFLTKTVIADTHDERYRQKIAKRLVMVCGYDPEQIITRNRLQVNAGTRAATIKIDFLIRHEDKTVMLIKYAPGSLVTRRLSTLAMSRIVKPYQVPVVVITNGEDADVMDGDTGRVTAHGLDGIMSRSILVEKMSGFSFRSIGSRVFDQASRIVYACEVDGACPCDTDICIIDQ